MTVADAQRVKRELLLRTLFPSMPVAAQIRFIEMLEDVEFAAGELVFAAGDPPDRFMFLTEGRVALETASLKSLEFSAFAALGVVDAVLERPRVRACRALEPSKALMIRAGDWFDLLEDNAEVARAAIRNFANQLHLLWQQWAQRLPQKQPERGIAPRTSELDNYGKILALRQAAFLRRAGMQATASLASVAETMALQPAQTLFEVGNEVHDFYVIVSGSIELSGPAELRFLHEAGDVVGGPAAFCNGLTDYGAHAHEQAVVLRIPEQEFYDQAEEHGRLLRGTLAYLASELETLQRVASD